MNTAQLEHLTALYEKAGAMREDLHAFTEGVKFTERPNTMDALFAALAYVATAEIRLSEALRRAQP